MAVNTCKMWSNGIKIAFFPKNLQKLPSGWSFALRPQGSTTTDREQTDREANDAD